MHMETGWPSSFDKASEKGAMLVIPLWDDHEANMLWLDYSYERNFNLWGYERKLFEHFWCRE